MYRNFPVLETERTIISAPRYNRVRLVLALLDKPARLDLTGIHDLQLVLNDDAWLCIDTGLGNLPVLPGRTSIPRTDADCTSRSVAASTTTTCMPS